MTPQEWCPGPAGIRPGIPSTSIPLSCQPLSLYANDPAIMHADGDWQAVEGLLSKDMATVGEHLQTWKLKLSAAKAVLVVFHLNNKKSNRELKSTTTMKLPFCTESTEYRWTGNSCTMSCLHRKSNRKKLTSCVALWRQLAGSGWDAGATMLC